MRARLTPHVKISIFALEIIYGSHCSANFHDSDSGPDLLPRLVGGLQKEIARESLTTPFQTVYHIVKRIAP
jgi:hypothetical protein